ncbi:phosphoglycerate kinase [Candidatus Saccharibacteria bacterium]|nr:phosphoglycerate kinase [Candidatus Saccharibacteria bacterium]
MAVELITLDKLYLRGKRVFVRVDYNVVENGKIIDDFRIEASLTTLQYLLKQDCALVLASHNGRPNGKPNKSLSLQPVARRLAQLLRREVVFMHDCVGKQVKAEATALRAGDIMMLENLRFHPGEEKDSAEFAKDLASLAEAYVDDAFANIHRAHASMVGVPKLLPHAAGKLVATEYKTLHHMLTKPTRPFTAVIGGVKVSDKIDVLYGLLDIVDNLLIGGAMANTFLAAAGNNMRASVVEKDHLRDANYIVEKAKQKGVKLYLPKDLVVAHSMQRGAAKHTVDVGSVRDGEAAYDLGDATMKGFSKVIKVSKTVFWNGTLGMAEIPDFATASQQLARAMLSSGAETVVGGGDTASFVDAEKLHDKFDFVSTGGGATLELIAGKKLPALEILFKK